MKRMLAGLVCALVATACVPPPKYPSEPWRCTLWGTDGDDVLETTRNGERICGLEGDDHLIIRHSGVIVLGGEGDDLIEGSNISNLQVYPGPGNDRMHFTDVRGLTVWAVGENAEADGVLHEYPDNGEGDDHLVVVGGTSVTAFLGVGNDRFDGHQTGGIEVDRPGTTYSVHAGDGDDIVRSSGRARHVISGGAGNDTIVVNGGLFSYAEANSLFGGPGDDVIYALNGWNDHIDLGDGPGGPRVVSPCGPAMPPAWPPAPGDYSFTCDLPQLSDHALTVTEDDVVATGSFLDQLMAADLEDLPALLDTLDLGPGDRAVGDSSDWPFGGY